MRDMTSISFDNFKLHENFDMWSITSRYSKKKRREERMWETCWRLTDDLFFDLLSITKALNLEHCFIDWIFINAVLQCLWLKLVKQIWAKRDDYYICCLLVSSSASANCYILFDFKLSSKTTLKLAFVLILEVNASHKTCENQLSHDAHVNNISAVWLWVSWWYLIVQSS